ncbi:SAM-dependent methyltransferase, partial [Saccharothrix sp. MB29]|nr:SAM-dependent methyltransferase [Saccharothrix sp. MB29]
SRLVSTYARHDLVDGSDTHGPDVRGRRFVTRQRLWRIALRPREVGALLLGYGWRKVEDVGAEECRARPGTAGRAVPVSPLERTVLAEKL